MEKQTIKIKEWEIRVDPDFSPMAELVGLDEKGNEYRLDFRYFSFGEKHTITPDIICTEKR